MFASAISSPCKAAVISLGASLSKTKCFAVPHIVTMNDRPTCYRRTSLQFDRRAPRILRAARVGGASVLFPGITVGENALIGAGSVVTPDVADRTIVAGNPARLVGRVPADQII